MTDEINTGNSEPEPKSVDNISPSELINRRSQPQAGNEVEKPEVQEEGATESTPEANTESQSTDVLSNMDLDNMSEAELKEIGQKLGTKAVARFGELTARRKQAEEKMQLMQKELSNLKNQKDKEIPVVADNPLKNISSAAELQKHRSSANEVVEWAENLLDEHEDYRSSDVIAEIDGKEYTKAEVKKTLKNSRNMLNKFIPAQAAVIQRNVSTVNTTKAFQRKAIQEFDWLKDSKNAKAQKYKAMLNDKRIANLASTNPELSAQMPYLLAHAANSMFSRQPVDPKKAGITPPRSVGNTAAKPERKPSTLSASQKEVSQRFKDSGNVNDFIALRTLQKSR